MCDCRAGMLTRCIALYDADHEDANCLVDQTAVETTPSTLTTTTTSDYKKSIRYGLADWSLQGTIQGISKYVSVMDILLVYVNTA